MPLPEFSESLSLTAALPTDLFQDIILPDLLSQHLHLLLVEPDPPKWHAFAVLPLVSRSWYYACQSLFSSLFGIKRRSDRSRSDDAEGLKDSDGFADPDDYDPSLSLDYAISMWKRVRRPLSNTNSLHHFDRDTLLADKSIIRVYTCLALGQIFLNEDVLLPLGAFSSHVGSDLSADEGHRNPWNEDYEEETEGPLQITSLDEASIHRCRIPFECAQRLCDTIAPKRLAYGVAEYMAVSLPVYHSLPLLAKYSGDLQFNVDRQYKLDLEDYAEWTSRTLYSLETVEQLLGTMMNFGRLVRSFWDESGIPPKALKLTNVIRALDDVVRADWGDATNSTRRRASALIRQWTAAM